MGVDTGGPLFTCVETHFVCESNTGYGYLNVQEKTNLQWSGGGGRVGFQQNRYRFDGRGYSDSDFFYQ